MLYSNYLQNVKNIDLSQLKELDTTNQMMLK